MLQQQIFNLTGVKCQGCVAKVSEALKGLEQVATFEINLAEAQLIVTYQDQPDAAAVIKAVASAGKYSAQLA